MSQHACYMGVLSYLLLTQIVPLQRYCCLTCHRCLLFHAISSDSKKLGVMLRSSSSLRTSMASHSQCSVKWMSMGHKQAHSSASWNKAFHHGWMRPLLETRSWAGISTSSSLIDTECQSNTTHLSWTTLNLNKTSIMSLWRDNLFSLLHEVSLLLLDEDSSVE